MTAFYPLAASSWGMEEIEAIQKVIESDRFTMGQEVFKFESLFAEHFGSKYAVMSNSGSSANLLALAALKYSSKAPEGARTEIIVPAVSWSTTFYPVSQLGFTLKFVDVDINTLNMDFSKVEDAISTRTAGILAVNLLGNPAQLSSLRDIAEREGIFLIEDNCESMGATLDGQYTGTFGSIGTFSTFFSHHMSTMEGGLCVTDDEELYQIMVSLRAHGWTRELPHDNHVFPKTGSAFEDLFRFVLPGYNLRPLEMSGALGQTQLAKLNDFLIHRRANAKRFTEHFGGLSEFLIQREIGDSSWFGFSLILREGLSGKRMLVVEELRRAGIDSRPIVAGNFARNPVMKHLNHSKLPSLPNADEIHENGLFVGNHHFDLSKQIDRLAHVLNKVSKSI